MTLKEAIAVLRAWLDRSQGPDSQERTAVRVVIRAIERWSQPAKRPSP
jgi:hypothetical protein